MTHQMYWKAVDTLSELPENDEHFEPVPTLWYLSPHNLQIAPLLLHIYDLTPEVSFGFLLSLSSPSLTQQINTRVNFASLDYT